MIDNYTQLSADQNLTKVIIVQPTVPSYRVEFFRRLHDTLGNSFAVYASMQDLGILTQRDGIPEWEFQLGPIQDIAPGLQWQTGAMSIPISSGDIFIVSGSPRCVSNVALLIKARMKGAITISWGHYWSSTSRPWRVGLRLFIARLAHALLFYTDREVDEYRQRYVGRKKLLVFALNNGLDTAEIVRLRTVYNPQERDRRMLFLGRINKKANLSLLLHALAEPNCLDVKLDVVGDGDASPSLHLMALKLGLGSRVVWHGASIDEPTIAKTANRSALFVYPGSVGLSLIHGLSYGLPAIVHDDRWGHMPEISALKNKKNGLLFQKGSVVSLAKTIAEALADTDRLKSLSDEAIATTTISYNADDMAIRFITAVETLRGKTHMNTMTRDKLLRP